MPLNFAIVGSNWITQSFIDAAHSTGGWRLTAVYSRSLDTAVGFAAKNDLPESACYTSLSTLCEEADVDAVYIASPNSLHLTQAIAVLQAGKHAIVEKPVVSNAAELAQLERVAGECYASSGAICIEAYRHIQETAFHTLQASLPSVGDVLGASISFCAYSSRMDAVYKGEVPNVFSRRFSGGCLVDMGVYPITFAVALFGKPLRQRYHATLLPLPCADGAGLAVLEYEKFTVTCQASKMFNSTQGVEIYGSDATLVVSGCTDISSISLRKHSDKGARTELLTTTPDKFNLADECRYFHKLITDNDKHGIDKLWEISKIVVGITTDLRRQAGIVFDCEVEQA